MKKQSGFSLLELLLVVSILLIIAAIAVPSVISSTQASNEAAAVHTLRQVVTAQNGYHNLYGNYSALASSLGGVESPTACPAIPASTAGCFLNDGISKQLDTGTMSGYTYKFIPPTDGQEWAMSATPASTYSGRKAYFVSQSGTVSYNNGTTAMTAPGTPLGQ